MKTKLIALVSIVSFITNIPELSAGTWIKKTISQAGKNKNPIGLTNEKTPESASEGLYTKYWADGNDIGFSITGWLQTRDKKSPSINEIRGGLFNASIIHEYQWSERHPARMAFSSNWTEVFYVQNKGNCDNSQLLNINGMSKAYARSAYNFASGPEHTMDNYTVYLTISAENRETKVKRSPDVKLLGTGEEYDLIRSKWDNKPDKKKSWEASGGDIVSFSVSMDNLTSDNIFSRGAIGSDIHVKLQDNAKSSLAGIFQELSGFDLVMDGTISDTQAYSIIPYTTANYNALKRIREIWYKASSKPNLSSHSSIRVGTFLNNLFLEFNSQSVDENILTESIKRYLEQFAYTFQGENEEQACYYMAWLLSEAAARPTITSEEMTNTRISFENLIDKLTSVLNENTKQAIGDANSPEIQEELNENLARVKGRLLYYFYELNADPLFPGFKRPIDYEVATVIIKKFKNEKILFNLLNNQVKDKPIEEFYAKWLSFYLDHVADRVVFWLVIETNKDEFRNPLYWGGMNYRARSCRNGLWPIEIYLTQIDNTYF
jgi:hypothetical protein